MVWNFIISIDDEPKSYGNGKIRMVEDYNENASGMESQSWKGCYPLYANDDKVSCSNN